MSGVAHDEVGAVVMHAALASPHEQMRRLAERCGRVHERCGDGRTAVARRGPQLVLVAVSGDPV